MNNVASVQVNNPNAPLFAIKFPDGSFFKDGPYNCWPLSSAKPIASNVAKKRNTTVTLVRIEEPVTSESPYDHVLEFVNQLKGKALTTELSAHNLSRGSDPVASKRERLIAHLLKCKADH